MKKTFNTSIGTLYLEYNNENNEVFLLDSKGVKFAEFDKITLEDDISKLNNITTLKDMLRLSFCQDISYKPIFDSENGVDVITIGFDKVYIAW